MMAALKDWLMTVIVVSLLCAAADSVMPEGGVKRVGGLACSVCLLCVVLTPLAEVRGISLTQQIMQWQEEMRTIRMELEEVTGQTQKEIIEAHCASYISDKAAELGLVCRVEVECVYHADGLWLPESVCIWGEVDDIAQSRMTELLERQFGVPSQRQTYYRTKEEGT